MEEEYGFNDYTIILKKFYLGGQPKTGLYAEKNDGSGKTVTLTVKDSVRKALEKFTHINKFELNQKMNAK